MVTIASGCYYKQAPPIIDGDLPLDAKVDTTPLPGNRIFVSSRRSLDFGSLEAADAHCMSDAADVGYTGTFVAWLSTAAMPARARLGTSAGWLSGPERPFANTVDDLVAGRTFYPIYVDDSGDGDSVATGTLGSGTAASDNCSDFTSTESECQFGLTNAAIGRWSENHPSWCAGQHPIYCFEIGKTVDVTPPAPTGRLAFLTDAPWLPAGGVAMADAHCQSEATSANRTGTFRALLASSAGSAASRFVGTGFGNPWFRPDGVEVTQPALLARGILTAPIHVTLTGDYVSALAWTGTNALHQTAAETCDDWASTTGTGNVTSTANGKTAAVVVELCTDAQRLRFTLRAMKYFTRWMWPSDAARWRGCAST